MKNNEFIRMPLAGKKNQGMDRPDLGWECRLRKQGVALVAGVDEAGRGPLAGPVHAAAVILPDDFSHSFLHDSKKLTSKTRESIFYEITTDSRIHWACAEATVEEIGEYNILRATHLAMKRALEALAIQPCHALVDGLPVKGLPVPHTALVKGDSLSLSIAAASVIAKVTRDHVMMQADQAYPMYGFSQHKGYGTAYHLEMLRLHGPSPLHRRGFAPVAQLSLDLGF